MHATLGRQFPGGQHMGVCEIADMHIIADRGSITRVEIAASITKGMTCVSGSWRSPISPSGSHPAALK
jgi:hypothetical protein